MKKAMLLAVSGWLALGCHQDGNVTKMQWMPDMADAPTTKTQKDFFNPPEHSIPMNSILYPDTVEEAEKVLVNPFPANAEMAAKGEQLFNTFCITCHGADAKGDKGMIGDLFPHPPDITSGDYPKRADGFFFYRITFGSASTIMPPYGHAISPHERWYIIHYLRTLQKKAAQP